MKIEVLPITNSFTIISTRYNTFRVETNASNKFIMSFKYTKTSATFNIPNLNESIKQIYHLIEKLLLTRMVLSEEPLTTILSRYCKQAIPRLWPSNVRTNSQVVVSYKSNEFLQNKSIHSFIPKL
jgi:hypothetical protein